MQEDKHEHEQRHDPRNNNNKEKKKIQTTREEIRNSTENLLSELDIHVGAIFHSHMTFHSPLSDIQVD